MTGVLDIQKLHVKRHNREVLQGINLTLERGEAAVLSGSNGCGKTTLLRSIAGLLPSAEGSIFLMGQDHRSNAWRQNRHRLAYVSQEQQGHEFPVTVEEMVASGMAGLRIKRSERAQRVLKALKDTGSNTLTGRYYFSLSGGERQRVALARCLCQGAEIMLLDEPLTYLDKEGRISFSRLLETIRRDYGISILLVTHTEDDLSETGWSKLKLENGVLVGAR